MALWRANSNAWPLSETIEKRAKAFKWSAGISLGRGTRDIEEVFAISVLAVISKPKKEKQESTRSILSKYYYSVNSGLRTIFA